MYSGIHLTGAIFLCFLTLHCSRGTRYQVLRVFFDGIPVADSLRTDNSGSPPEHAVPAANAVQDTLQTERPAWYYHPAQDASECKACHDIGQSFRLYAQAAELCGRCHTFKDNPIVHNPVEGNACTECHNPHGSQNEHILVATERELCATCHDVWADEFEVAGSTHAPVSAGKCGQCHDPHASKHQTLLLKPTDQLCVDCHSLQKMALAETQYLHPPFESGECLSCHAAHGSSEPSLLAKSSQALCYDCHYKADFRDPETHADIDDMPCYECHNPHGADNEFLIR